MHKKHGFTLIELLTVVLILGILTSVAMPQYRKAIRRTEAANALVNVKIIFDAAKQRYARSTQWPTSLADLTVEFAEANVKESGEFEIGDFTYSFGDKTTDCLKTNDCYVEAKRQKKENDPFYSLKAYYAKGQNNNRQRDVYTCSWSGDRYKTLCESFCHGSEEGKTECEIK